MRTVGILTLGCKVNTYESEYIIHLLKEAGYQIKDFDDACDVYIINTCTVTNTSDIKSRKMIRKAIRKIRMLVLLPWDVLLKQIKIFSYQVLILF